jgi:hypothetical protein
MSVPHPMTPQAGSHTLTPPHTLCVLPCDGQVMLNNGVMMPVIGYGTAGLADGAANSVVAALHAGYRHIDSAQVNQPAQLCCPDRQVPVCTAACLSLIHCGCAPTHG